MAKPMNVPEVMALITTMAETADILSLPEDWLEEYLVGVAHKRGREVAQDTVKLAVEFWRQEHLEALHWQQVRARGERHAG